MRLRRCLEIESNDYELNNFTMLILRFARIGGWINAKWINAKNVNRE